MQKMICIPVERYEQMLESYDKVLAELEETKRILKEWRETHGNFAENNYKGALFDY